MNIFIYGTSAFRKKMQLILDRGNIRFKIDGGKVEEIISLVSLRELIEEDPHQIFLIEEVKIIENDFVSKFLKFLVPKDGITKKYLDEYGIGDISLRDETDLIIYLERRLEANVKKIPKADEITSIDDMLGIFEDADGNIKG